MSQFEQLVNRAKSEEQPQRMLFLFARAINMFDQKMYSHQSGTIEPVMCVDKSPEELTTFKALMNEADGFTRNWNFIFASTLSGKENAQPTPEEVDNALKKMSNIFQEKSDLSQFIIWDRQEQTIIVS